MDRSQVDSIRFCPSCGNSGGGRVASNLYRCLSCGGDFYCNTAAAAGVFLVDPSRRVLWIRRAQNPGKGMLGIPGGFIDPGESVEEAVRREVAEEIGGTCDEIHFLMSRPNLYPFRGILYNTIDIFFWGRVPNFDAFHPKSEVQQLEPLSLDSVPLDEIVFDSIRDAFVQLRKKF